MDSIYGPAEWIALARHIYLGPAWGGDSVVDTLDFILYGGTAEAVPHRLWDTMNDPKRRIEFLDISSSGEIVGWALPDRSTSEMDGPARLYEHLVTTLSDFEPRFDGSVRCLC